MKIGLTIVIIILILAGIVSLGLRVEPNAFASYAGQTAELTTIPAPESLPAPVARFYHQTFGDELPVINSAVVSGRASIRPFGITLPARFRFVYEAGQNYRHYIEATFLGIPIMKVNEWYLDGHGRLELPIFGTAQGPKTDQAANLGLWAESTYFPTIWLTDPRVSWEPLDEDTAILVVPFGADQQRFVVRFDPESGRLALLEAMRYRDEAGEKILWLAANVPGEMIEVGGAQLAATGSATWVDQGSPWATFTAEEIVYNVDVRDYIRANGP